jgi:uncharacterized protein DUF4145
MQESTTLAVVNCIRCQKLMPGRAHGAYQYVSPGGQYWAHEFTLMECTGCHHPFVVETFSPARNEFGEYDDDCWTPPEQVLPTLDEAVDSSVPEVVSASYLEAKRCLFGRNFTATVLMARRTIELVCKHFGAEGGNLKKGLEDLKSKKILDERMHRWADHVLRDLGNSGAHDVTPISPDDAADAVEFTKAIVWHVFVFEAAFERHMARRESPGEEGSS